MAKLCPCGSSKNYTECCGLYISAGLDAPSPEALMRSRYTAFKNGNVAYIAKTQLSPEVNDKPDSIRWLKLEILMTELSENKQQGVVEFRAYYQYRGQKHVLHEISQFSLKNGRWNYTDGEVIHECCSGH